MEVRELDYKKDIDEAVRVFNRSFPNKISKEYFDWKHRENPFGRSYGLVAIEDEKIVAIRMFMKWKFSREGKIHKAIRPVDTCTDPDYRGKGIFKKLTLQGLEETKGDYDFIFNTPNANSIEGYLKMGWKKLEKPIDYNLGLVNPFSDRKEFEMMSINELDADVVPTNNRLFSTQLSLDYLKWRYRFSKYKLAQFQDKTIVVFRLTKIKGLKVLIPLELCGAEKDINSHLNSLALKHQAPLIYFLNNKKLKDTKFLVSFKRGNQNVVIKDDENVGIKNLKFSAGDLEGIM